MEKSYRRLCTQLGLTMLFHLFLINVVTTGAILIYESLSVSMSYRAYSVGYELLSAALYLLSFMLPVLFFRIIARGEPPVSMGMEPTMPARAVPMIFALMGVNLACAYCNSLFMRLLEAMGIGNLLDYIPLSSFEYPEDFVLLHLSLSLVPAFCEEFLFRGLICARLLPYGKTTAIVGSAILFGLMHGNLGQLFYATMAGILLGWCYAETRSIWPGVIAHMLNNLTGFLSEYWYFALPPARAQQIDVLFTTAVLCVGMICLIWLIASRRGERPLLGLGNTRPTADLAAAPLSGEACVRGFFRPAMVVYFALAVGGILFFLLFGSLLSALEAAGIAFEF